MCERGAAGAGKGGTNGSELTEEISGLSVMCSVTGVCGNPQALPV